MGAISSLKQFFARPESLVTQLGNPFLHLDTEVAARDLRLEERGTENGLLGLPSTSAKNLDPVEREIVDRVVGVARQAEQEVAAQFQAYDERISGLGLLAQVPVIAVTSTQAVGEMQAAVAKANLRLTTARENVSQSYEQLRAFRRDHVIQRPAKLDIPFMATTGAIVLTWVGETALNSFLLRQNDDMGLLGGIIAAAAVGAINIGTAAFVGRIVWPLMNVRALLQRSFGIGVTGLWAILTVVWNLLAAHYRDAKVAGLPTPESAALRMFGSAPESIYSWGLFTLGIIFSVIAARSAYRMDDPYPGYGAVSREHHSRCQDYAAEVGDATEELSDIRGEAVDEISDVRRELATQLADRDRALNGRNAFVQRYIRFHAELESAVNQLLAIYRNANRRARSTPAPNRFDELFQLPPLALQPAPQLQITTEHVAKADLTLMDAVEKMSAAYLDGIDRFETLESLNAKLSHG